MTCWNDLPLEVKFMIARECVMDEASCVMFGYEYDNNERGTVTYARGQRHWKGVLDLLEVVPEVKDSIRVTAQRLHEDNSQTWRTAEINRARVRLDLLRRGLPSRSTVDFEKAEKACKVALVNKDAVKNLLELLEGVGL